MHVAVIESETCTSAVIHRMASKVISLKTFFAQELNNNKQYGGNECNGLRRNIYTSYKDFNNNSKPTITFSLILLSKDFSLSAALSNDVKVVKVERRVNQDAVVVMLGSLCKTHSAKHGQCSAKFPVCSCLLSYLEN